MRSLELYTGILFVLLDGQNGRPLLQEIHGLWTLDYLRHIDLVRVSNVKLVYAGTV